MRSWETDPEVRAVKMRGEACKPFETELDIEGLVLLAGKMELKEAGLRDYVRGKEDPLYDVLCPENLRQLWELQRLLPTLFTREFARRGRSSYEVKHICEDFVPNSYISNSSTILMMTYLNIPWTYVKGDPINANVRAQMADGFVLMNRLAKYTQYIREHKNPWENKPKANDPGTSSA